MRRPLGVLAVDAADVRADLAEGLDRLAAAVEDHVRRIEIHKQVLAVHLADELQQGVGRLLAGLQVQVLPVAPAVVAQRGCRFLVFGRDLGTGFMQLADLDLPEVLRSICRDVPPEIFHEDVSSTGIRKSGAW
jgi:hypothetical protein